jgi:hypothetical protein
VGQQGGDRCDDIDPGKGHAEALTIAVPIWEPTLRLQMPSSHHAENTHLVSSTGV